MYVRDLLTRKKPSRSVRAFNETILNFFFFNYYFFVRNFIKIILVICLTAKNWTEIEKLKIRTWKLNMEFFKTVKIHGKRSDCTITATWKWTIKKENRHSFPAEKKEKKKKITRELSLFVTENIVFLFPVLSFSSWTLTRISKHEFTRECYQHWVFLHRNSWWSNTAHHRTLYLTYLRETKNWC